ncbi:MAG: type II toxin-antitoxin system HicB family antitoxin [Dehalococcoidia bacterium]|nr:type II toxin-antitoxin system HicB family antitoxin [Dehalococcoidia bacterium]
MRTYTVPITLQREEDGRWSASAPDLPGCGTWGYSQDEALRHVQEAVALYIESLVARGLPIPPGVTACEATAVTVTVTAA